MEQVAHNLMVASTFNEDEGHWMHNIAVVISDIDHDKKTVLKSEQFYMAIMPSMSPPALIKGLREMLDSMESYIEGKDNEVG